MKIFLDTEFIEDGKTIDLMSIGLVREDGEKYYAVNSECDLSKADDWVKANVIPHLFNDKFTKERYSKSKEQIKNDIITFVGFDPEFWAYYADYDWVVVCQLFGRMMDLPKHFPMFCLDLKQMLHIYKIEKEDLKVANQQEHNALADAVELHDMYKSLTQILFREFKLNN